MEGWMDGKTLFVIAQSPINQNRIATSDIDINMDIVIDR